MAGVALDGDFTNGSSALPTGNGSAGGSLGAALGFRFVVLPGDTNQTGLVDNNDADVIYNGYFTGIGSPGYSFLADTDGSGMLDNNDADVVYGNFFILGPVGFAGTLSTNGGLEGGLSNQGLSGETASPGVGPVDSGNSGLIYTTGIDYGILADSDSQDEVPLGLDDYASSVDSLLEDLLNDLSPM